MALLSRQTPSLGLKRRPEIPLLLRPLLRAYLLGYASSTVPRILTLLITQVTRKRRVGEDENRWENIATSLLRILRGGLEIQRFATFCAALVGGSTFLQIPVEKLFAKFAPGLSKIARLRLSRWLSTFIAAWFSIKLLQTKESEAFIDRVPPNTYSPTGVLLKSRHFAGRTMDLTLFAVTRALDVLIGEAWSQRKTHRLALNKWTKFDTAVGYLTDPALFAASSALIMWSWIYLPERLPRAYNKWIASAAAVDPRLITALQHCRWGSLQYGRETGEAHILQSMCADYHWPLSWGDPVQSIPFPCEVVHMGTGPNCELHGLSRFLKGFAMALGTYGPLNLALQLRSPSKKGMQRALVSSLRSSAFLGAFIALFYYSICLARTRLGPHLLGKDTKSRQRIDSGICVGAGCASCGWSILLENSGRRKDIALFVAPRALATCLPRRYELRHVWRENVAFAGAVAVVFTCVRERPERVRGVLGKVLKSVLVN